MMTEDAASEELVGLQQLVAGTAEESRRLKALHSKGKLQENVAAEVVSTIMPLLQELAQLSADHAAAIEEWAEAIDDAIEGGDEPGLDEEEVQLFSWLLDRLGNFVQGGKQAPNIPEDLKKGFVEIEVKLALARDILKRFEEDEDEDVEEEPELASEQSDEDADDAEEPTGS